MAAYRLSPKAVADLDGIYILNFGLAQAQDYLIGLHERFRNLAANPELGRSAEELAPSIRRYEYQSHMAFYRPDEHGVLIVRVPHQSMDTRRHL